jgi:hypothetical protein
MAGAYETSYSNDEHVRRLTRELEHRYQALFGPPCDRDDLSWSREDAPRCDDSELLPPRPLGGVTGGHDCEEKPRFSY